MSIKAHYVLDAPSEDVLFDLVEDAIDDLNAGSGLAFGFDEVESPDGVANHYVYLDEEGRGKVTFVDDPETPVGYLIVEAHDDATTRRVGDAVAAVLPVRTVASLREKARSEMAEDPGHLVRMAVGSAGQADDETLSILRDGLASDDREVRISAIEAASLTQWPQADPLLREAEENDADPEVREWAGNARTALQTALGN